MTFSQQNQNFIRMRLQAELRGKSELEKNQIYTSKYQKETRDRINDFFNGNPILSERIDCYKTLIDILPSCEANYILNLIYFDPNSDKILLEIRSSLIVLVESDDLSILPLLKISKFDDKSFESFLNDYFGKKLDVSKCNVRGEQQNRNDFINLFVDRLCNKLCSENSGPESLQMLLHFTKVWQLYYSAPYQFNKALIMLNYLIKTLKEVRSELKLNPIDIFDTLLIVLDAIPTRFPRPPFIDNPQEAEKRAEVKQWYLDKLQDFKNLLSDCNETFADYSRVKYGKLFTDFTVSSDIIRTKIKAAISDRIDNGDFPSSEEVIQLHVRSKMEKQRDLSYLLEEVARKCYYFEILNFKNLHGVRS